MDLLRALVSGCVHTARAPDFIKISCSKATDNLFFFFLTPTKESKIWKIPRWFWSLAEKKKNFGQTSVKYFQVPVMRICNPWMHIRVTWGAFKNPDGYPTPPPHPRHPNQLHSTLCGAEPKHQGSLSRQVAPTCSQV